MVFGHCVCSPYPRVAAVWASLPVNQFLSCRSSSSLTSFSRRALSCPRFSSYEDAIACSWRRRLISAFSSNCFLRAVYDLLLLRRLGSPSGFFFQCSFFAIRRFLEDFLLLSFSSPDRGGDHLPLFDFFSPMRMPSVPAQLIGLR